MNAARDACDVVVVGAGPAGLAAAQAAHACGATVALIDEYPTLGGQIFKQPAPRLRPRPTAVGIGAGDARVRGVLASEIRVLTDCLVWSAAPGVVHFRQGDRMGSLHCRAIVAACGAYERPAIFPGWERPGVMTPGGAQTLVKSQGCLPGRRVVLAGCGPFLLPVAASILRAGADIVGIYEMTQPQDWLRHAGSALRHGARLLEAIRYWRELRTAKVAVRFGHRVVRAEGSPALERVVLARCEADGTVVAGSETELHADLLLASYGFVPAVQLTRLLGCEHRYDSLRGGWIPCHDATMATTVPSVFVAGEAAGIGGVYAALAEGELAGLAAAAAVGRRLPGGRRARALRAARRHRSFGDLVNRMFSVPEAVHCGIDDDTLVCRCEEVSAGEIRRAVTDWAADVNRVKGVTRCGMGYCQGRICGPAVQSITADRSGRALDSVGSFTVRTPLKPMPAAALALYASQLDESGEA